MAGWLLPVVFRTDVRHEQVPNGVGDVRIMVVYFRTTLGDEQISAFNHEAI